jgi:2,4-dienoyl-CoA reductase-like NADH-dependent reductase (Old Yellow Enzyme family)
MSTATAGYKLFTPITLGKDLVLKNRIVLAPMTRARSDKITKVPTELNELYYEQRAGAGLIITEGVAISEQGFGWLGAPGIYNDDHVEGWKKVVDRVHQKGGKIFLQLWHLGRQGHPSLNSKNELVSASAIGLSQGTTRNANGESVPYATPRALETDEVSTVVKDYAHAAACAKKAGFDGVEVHGANGYLVDQFLQSSTNKRTDKYGGSIENRTRFLLEIIEELKTVYPSDRIGVRLSPNGAFGGMGSEDNAEQFTYAIEQLSKHNLGYLAVLDGFGFGYHDKCRLLTAFDVKLAFKGTVIAHNSYTRDIAEGAIRSGAADLVGFGRDYISNPDLAERFENDWPLNGPADYTVYWDGSKGAEGYTDFPAYSSKD